MPGKLLNCEDLTTSSSSGGFNELSRLPHESWIPALRHPCDFDSRIFEDVSLNLLKNPNINSSLLFRADVLYDSEDEKLTDELLSETQRRQALVNYNVQNDELSGFTVKRTFLRRMIPRNPQLDKPVLQTCVFLCSSDSVEKIKKTIVVYVPHASSIDEIPWYHPRVESLAYLHSWHPSDTPVGNISLHYRLYPSETLPLSPRLQRMGQHLLSTIHKHGQGQLAGYQKRVQHDQILSQQRVQDRYTHLKENHAQRLSDNWVESTESSKHVFEDLGIAAFLIELWKDMYGEDKGQGTSNVKGPTKPGKKRPFVGFVDIGCGNGVLVDVLIREGYRGWGFDARKRKSWLTFLHSTQKHLEQRILVPEPFATYTSPSLKKSHPIKDSILRNHFLPAILKFHKSEDLPIHHNGIFPYGTFIISNHADELTPWTPLLASLSDSPFLCIPCCSHNLSGQRFRAPSVFNNHSADVHAPKYFAGNVSRAKCVPLMTSRMHENDTFEVDEGFEASTGQVAESGDLKALSKQTRTKQPSAYASLCDWVDNLAGRVGYEVEREMLRLPSTRNLGIVGRTLKKGFEDDEVEKRRERVEAIVIEEKADGEAWLARAKGLTEGQDGGH